MAGMAVSAFNVAKELAHPATLYVAKLVITKGTMHPADVEGFCNCGKCVNAKGCATASHTRQLGLLESKARRAKHVTKRPTPPKPQPPDGD